MNRRRRGDECTRRVAKNQVGWIEKLVRRWIGGRPSRRDGRTGGSFQVTKKMSARAGRLNHRKTGEPKKKKKVLDGGTGGRVVNIGAENRKGGKSGA